MEVQTFVHSFELNDYIDFVAPSGSIPVSS